MSYHGAVVGAIISSYLFSRRHKGVLFKIIDVVALSIPVGYLFGRIGNFRKSGVGGASYRCALGDIC